MNALKKVRNLAMTFALVGALSVPMIAQADTICIIGTDFIICVID